MRKAVRNVVNVLDGKPGGLRGQSLLEMAFTFPLLILMVLSLVEVGWLANNYLILMDAVRAAGRDAVNLDPTLWNEQNTRNLNHLDCDQSDTDHPARTPLTSLTDRYTVGDDGRFGFFDEIACEVVRGMTPLQLNEADYPQGKDDVVVSAISYKLVDYKQISHPNNPTYRQGPGSRDDSWVTVTGRWPLRNRYCASSGPVGDERDPFDWQSSKYGSGRDGQDDGDEGLPGDPPGGPSTFLTPATNQQVRGFVYTGNNKNDDNCIGSKFTVQDIETRMNLDEGPFNREVPNGGLVIVEVFWQHHPLVLGPLFQGFTGNRLNDPVLWVWGWFPVPSAKPTPTNTTP